MDSACGGAPDSLREALAPEATAAGNGEELRNSLKGIRNSSGRQHRALDQVFQLAYVAGPGIIVSVHHICGNVLHRFAGAG
jgi:hypothetical protein